MISRSIDEEMKNSYLEYAMSVIIGRAIPDVRDGLKPVQRRILYGMYELGLTHDKPHKKSARIVGEVMGKYHPHGDAPIYEALVRMAQNFTMRYVLVDGQGNFGSLDDDPPAAMRYTEARLSRISEELLDGIEEDSVDFQPNFDGSALEPVVLPSKFPNLLVNGSSGIAVGMTTNIPPHNLCEVVDAIKYYIQNPDCSVEEIMEYIKGPDFPTGGIICGTAGILEAYKTGKGIIKIRATAEIIERGKKKEIIIKDIPYDVKKSTILEKIAELAREKKIDGIVDLRDESDREGIRIVIKLREDCDASIVLNQLYEYSPLESTYSIINLVLVNNEPRLLNIKELIEEFVKHRLEVVTRQAQYHLKKAEEREHILIGLNVALENIDDIINILKTSESVEEATKRIMERYSLTETQVKVILDMPLQKLSKMEKLKIKNELENIRKRIVELKEFLESRELKLKKICSELDEIKKKYGDSRKTKIEEIYEKREVEDLVPEEENILLINSEGYIKRLSIDEFYPERGRLHVESDTKILTKINSHETVFFFSNAGRGFSIKGYEIPKGTKRGRGKPIRALINLKDGEVIVAALPSKIMRGKYIYLVTRRGYVKKIPISELSNLRSSGTSITRLKKDDSVIGVLPAGVDCEMFLITRLGKALKIRCEDIPEGEKHVIGKEGIKLADDEVVSASILRREKYLLIGTKRGLFKRIEIYGKDGIKTARAGAKGITVLKMDSKSGEVVSGLVVDEDEELIVLTKSGKCIKIGASKVPVLGRNTKGSRIIKLEENDEVINVLKVI